MTFLATITNRQSNKIALIVSVIAALLVTVLFIRFGERQWDFKVYYFGAQAQTLGLSAYSASTIQKLSGSTLDLYYLYPPLTLYLFYPFLLIPYSVALILYVIAKGFMFIVFLLVWRKLLPPSSTILFCLFCLLSFNGCLYLDFVSGNISLVEQTMISIACYCYVTRRFSLFCIFILLASIFKILPLSFLFLLILSKEKNRYTLLSLSFVLFGLYCGLSYLIQPEQCREWIQTVGYIASLDGRGIYNPSLFSLSKEIVSLFRANPVDVHSSIIAFILYVLLALSLLLVSQLLSRRYFISSKENPERIFIILACFLYILLLPRLKDYSFVLILGPAFYTLIKVQSNKIKLLLLGGALVFFNYMTIPGLSLFTAVVLPYYPLLITALFWLVLLYEINAISKSTINQKITS